MSEEKIEQFWRPATADDVARVMRGEKVEARFRRKEEDCWVASGVDGCSLNLAGWYKDAWLDHEYDVWAQCQVYDPQQWWLDKPDPGEGYRLLGKFPPERLQQGDEYWSTAESRWILSPVAGAGGTKQLKESRYRRRIEAKPTQCVGRVCGLAKSTGVYCPHDTCDLETGVRIANNPEIPDSSNSSENPNSCRSRDTIPSGWRLLGKDEERLASDAYWSLGAKDWVIIGDNRVAIANMLPRGRDIRRLGSFDLVVGFNYTLPSGKQIRITAKGFEVE